MSNWTEQGHLVGLERWFVTQTTAFIERGNARARTYFVEKFGGSSRSTSTVVERDVGKGPAGLRSDGRQEIMD